MEHVTDLATVSDKASGETASLTRARRVLEREFMLTTREASIYINATMGSMVKAQPTREQIRVLTYRQTEDLAERAGSALDIQSELAARKFGANVHGLTRGEIAGEDGADAFRAVVAAVSRDQDVRQLDDASLAAIHGEGGADRMRTSHRAVPADAPPLLEAADEADEADPDDADALREWDEENRRHDQ